MLTYRMTAAQSDTWILGGAAAAQVEAEIAEQVQAADCTEEVLVLVDDDSVAYMLELGRCL
jgi:hypothetical protein